MARQDDGQQLIAGFFEALQERAFGRCRLRIRALERRAKRQPALGAWASYLSGILAFEAEHNYARAEQRFTQLLRQDALAAELRHRVQYALGRCYDIEGRWAEAIGIFENMIAVAQPIEQAKAWKHIAISICRGFNLGDLDANQLAYADECCQRALEALEALPEQSSGLTLQIGSIWNTRGATAMQQGRLDAALAYYQRDMTICEAAGEQHGLGISYMNQGEIHHQRGPQAWPEALACYQRARALLHDDPVLEADLLANLGALYQALGQPARALDFYRQAIDVIEAIRAEVSSEAGRAGFFATVVDTYAHAILLSLSLDDIAGAFAYCERARSRAFLDMLAARSPALSKRAAVRPATLAEVQAALPADTLLLEYFTTGLAENLIKRADRPAQRHRFPQECTLLFAIRRDSADAYQLAISPNALRPSQLSSVVEQHFLQPERRRLLYEHLLAKAEACLAGVRQLTIVPHGPLHYIPFQALIAADGQTLLRDGGPTISYAPSATFLLGRAQRPRGRPTLPSLAIGYNGEPPAQLRGAEEEARRVAQMTGGQALLGSMPKKDTLYATAANHRLLHFSCHGAFAPEQPFESALILAPGERLTAIDILTHLRLRCDLVALSACESGLSRIRRGDELEGLTRAFLSAGARNLLCSLWQVDDRSTRLLIEQFYQEILSGRAFPEALQRAQLHLMRLTRGEARANEPDSQLDGGERARVFADPYYWAAFILVVGR